MIASIEAGAESLLSHFQLDSNWHWESEILCETPGCRLVTHYRFHPVREQSHPSAFETVGKFYSDAKTGEHCYHAMNAIHALLASDKNAPLAIPEPLFYSSEYKLLSLKWVEHQPYADLISSPDYQRYLRLVGKALAYLHRLPVAYGQEKNMDDHLAELITPHPLTMASSLPLFAKRLHSIVNSLRHLERQFVPKFSPLPLHRDFHLRQLFCDKDKVWLIDWDMYGLGDPALDVGNFLVYLETRFPEKSTLAGNAFLEGYHSLMPTQTPNINLYRVLTYLRLACKAYRLQHLDWVNRADQFLTKCENLLVQDILWL